MSSKGRRARRWGALAAGLAAAASYAALGPVYGGRLRVGVAELPAGGEPGAVHGAGARLVAGLTHEVLVNIGPEGLPAPGLARSWTAGAGGLEWTLTLDPQARFHDGRALEAADALRSLRRFLRSPSPAATWLAQGLVGGAEFRARRTHALDGLYASDPQRLVLRLTEAVALPLAPLAAPGAAVTGPANQTCGPFVPTLRGATTLALNAFGAHVQGRPLLDELELLAAPREELSRRLAAGQLDVVVDDGLVPRGAVETTPCATLLMVLNARRAPFSTPEARHAASSALAAPEALGPFLPGARPASALLPPALLGAPVAGSPASGSLTGGPWRCTLGVARDVPAALSQRVVALMSEAGFAVSVDARAPGELWRAPADARLLLFVPEVAEAGLALHELLAWGAPAPEAEAALAAARVERDFDRRRGRLLAAEAALRQAGTLVPLAWVPLGAASGPGVHGLRVDAGGTLRLADAWRQP